MLPDWLNFSHLWRFLRRRGYIAVFLTLFGVSSVAVSLVPIAVRSQEAKPIQQAEEQVIRQFALPPAPAEPPVYWEAPAEPVYEPAPAPAAEYYPAESAPMPTSAPAAPAATTTATTPSTPASTNNTRTVPPNEYVWEFNRSPDTKNRLRLEGVYPDMRLGFTRPRNWEVQSAKAVIKFRQSASLLPERSNLTVRINDTAVGTVPLNRVNGQIGQVAFPIPANLIQTQNEIMLLAEQQTSEDCTNPNTPTLWTEILPSSRIVFTYKTQPVSLDFSRYPYPIVDEFSLNSNKVAYLRPNTMDSDWLTAVSRFQAQLGRLLDYRPLETRIIDDVSQLKPEERLVVLGTPDTQPLLKELKLPFTLKQGRILDGQQKPLPGDVGVLMLTTLGEQKSDRNNAQTSEADRNTPILIATGNSVSGMNKAVQFLVQAQDRQIGTGEALIVNSLEEVTSPKPRDWIGYLPNSNRFTLSDLATDNRQFFVDTTVHGANAPEVKIPFHTLPGDRVLRGSTVTLQYSYSPQLNPRTSAVEVALDGITLGAERLTSTGGGRGSLTVNLPDDVVRPDSNLYVRFVLQPLENGVCGLEADRQLWGTVHSDTSVDLRRDTVTRLPDLRLLKVGFPLTAPQDLSTTALILPDRPTDAELNLLLSMSKRLGQITQSDSIKLNAYFAKNLTSEIKSNQNLVSIGVRDRLPTPEALATKGFTLNTAFLRQNGATQVQALPDGEGVLKSVVSPWNEDRVLLALTAQREQGLRDVRDLVEIDRLFGQLEGDTALVHRNQPDPSPYDSEGYSLEFLNNAPQQRVVTQTSFLGGLVMFIQNNWLLLPLGIVLLPLLLYGFSQMFLNRVADGGSGS